MGIEYELKFRATAQQQAAVRKDFPEQEQHLQMQTVYYDTPDGALSERFYTLRRRLENGRAVCTLKAPEKGLGRGEWEVDCAEVLEAIPELCKLGAPADLPELTTRGLIPVCGARFTRITKLLVLEDCTLELALDEGVLMGADRQEPLCEIEVELKAGSRQAAQRFGAYLARRYGLIPEKASKFRRARALSKGEHHGTGSVF